MNNPIISNKKVFATYSLAWFFIALMNLSLLFFSIGISFYSALFESFIFNFIYFILGIGIWYTVRYNSLETYNAAKLFINHFLAAVITSGIWILTSELIIYQFLLNDKNYLSFLNTSSIWRFLIGILFYIVLIVIDYLFIYYNNFKEKVLKESELKSLIREAELNALKYQINPHFIFNSLNSISALTLSNPKLAQEMTIKLSAFLRNTLTKNDNQKSKLIDEINASKLYLEIEKVRFHDKFEFVEELHDECKELTVPTMILQPLFENAIKHGVYESIENITIILSCKKENDFIKISVKNNFDPQSIPKKGEGIGIKNIQTRMRLLYGQDNLVVVKKSNNIFEVTIYIPLS